MAKHLAPGNYYNAILTSETNETFHVPFYVRELNVYYVNGDEWYEKIDSDEAYRDERGIRKHDDYDFDYLIDFSVDEESVDRGEAMDNFVLIEDEHEIAKAKAAVDAHMDYLSNMAGKYEAQYC